MLVRRSRRSAPGVTNRSEASVPGTAERIFTYGLSFAGLMAVAFALSSLLGLALIPVIPGAAELISAADAKVRVSYSLAALIVGAPLWLGLWRHAQRRTNQNPAERDTTERRLYFGA